MIDRNVEFPNRFRMTLVPGTDDIYEVVPAPGDVIAAGDTFSKVNMLPDSIPALLGLKMANPQVKDALNVLANVGNLHVWERVQDGVTDYLTSTDRNAYTDGTVGNTTITYLGQLGGGARIEVVSYVGTGTYGVNNPCSITADFKIKAVLYVAEMRDGRLIPGSASYYDTDSMFSDILTTNFIVGKGLYCGEPGYYNRGYGKKSADGKTFYWYSSKDAESQLNYSSSTYFLVVIS